MPTEPSPGKAIWVKWTGFKPQRFTRVDRYILGEVIKPFLGGVVFLSFVFLMFQMLRLAEFFIIHGVPTAILGKMILLMTLSFMPLALPVAFLSAVLIAFGRLSSDSELVAMKACGFSVIRLTLPVLLLSTSLVVLSLWLNMDWVPRGDRLFKSTLIKVSNTKVVSSIREGTFTSGFFDLLIFADRVDSKTNKMSRVFIYDEREPKSPMTVVANEGEIISLKPSNELGATAMLKLSRGNIHRNDLVEKIYQKMDFGEYRLYLNVLEGADTSTIKPKMLPYRELLINIELQDAQSPFKRELKAEYWRRFAVALSPFIFVFLGVGIGTVRTRTVRSGAALVTLLVVSFYWSAQAFGFIAAQKNWMPPFLAMQLPNLITLAISSRFFKSATW